MIQLQETINNRKIFYLQISNDLQPLMEADLQNWALLVIEDNASNPLLWEFAELCIDKEVCYMQAVGNGSTKIDDVFDEVMVVRELDGGKLPSWMITSDDVLMTAWNDDVAEGFWFITNAAQYENVVIDIVLVANLTPVDYLPTIKELAGKMSEGWMPSDAP